MDETIPPEVPPRSALRRGHRYSNSTPACIHAYANRPLPPLPAPPSAAPRAVTPQPSKPEPSPSFTSSMAFAYHGSFPINRKNTTRGQTTSAPRRAPSVTVASSPSPMAGHPHRNSYAASTRSRRSSQKVHQLTGMDVDVMDDQSLRSVSEYSDTSSAESGVRLDDLGVTYDIPDYYLVPVLETDGDDSSSRGSSWGPLSPESATVPSPLNVHRPSIRDGSEKNLGSMSGSFTNMHLDDDTVRPWDPAFGQFSDHRAAGEYHQFTADLASRHSRQLSDSSLQSSVTAKKKRSSLSLAFSAASRFRRRETAPPQPKEITPLPLPQPLPRPRKPESVPHAIDFASALPIPTMSNRDASKKQSQRKKSQSQSSSPNMDPTAKMGIPSHSAPATPALPMSASAPPRPSPAPPLMSAWDSDSDDDGHVISSLKEWFASRNTEEAKIHRRTSSATRLGSDGQFTGMRQDQMRESIIRPKDRQRQIQMEKAEKRREEMRRQIKVVPEGVAF